MAFLWSDARARVQERILNPHNPSILNKISSTFQHVSGGSQPYSMAVGILKMVFNAPPYIGRSLAEFATQPLIEHLPHIRPTSDQNKLPGYWFSRDVAQQPDLARWELDHDSYDVILIYHHGGAFYVGHALMYSTWMTTLALNTRLRIRIYTVEYDLADKSKPETHYPYQQRTLFEAYTHLLSMGVPAEKLFIGGDSSGGFNALKCLEHIVDDSVARPAGIILNSPLLDLWLPRDKEDELAHLGPGNSLESNRTNDYVGPAFLKNGLDAYKAPISSGPVHKGMQWYADNLPATFLAYGTGEVLMDYIKGFQDEMDRAGKDLTVFVGKDEVHIFNILEPRYSRDKEGWKKGVDVLISWLSRSHSESEVLKNKE